MICHRRSFFGCGSVAPSPAFDSVAPSRVKNRSPSSDMTCSRPRKRLGAQRRVSHSWTSPAIFCRANSLAISGNSLELQYLLVFVSFWGISPALFWNYTGLMACIKMIWVTICWYIYISELPEVVICLQGWTSPGKNCIYGGPNLEKVNFSCMPGRKGYCIPALGSRLSWHIQSRI